MYYKTKLSSPKIAIHKKVYAISESAPLESIDYTYNIRGWLSWINRDQMSVPDLGGKLFSYKIKYNEKEGITSPDPTQFPGKEVMAKYNGNIAEADWRSVENIGSSPSIAPKRYGYVYDRLNRLTAGFYQTPNNPGLGENTESLTYDLNGNITKLFRTSILEYGNTTPTKIDDLEYIYDAQNKSNKLITLNDNSYNPTGYEGGGMEIKYDLNENMTGMPDKGINQIDYNYLNLPGKISYSRGGTESAIITTRYSAEGIKLQKENNTTVFGFNGSSTTTKITDYLDGFQYLITLTPPPPGGFESLMTANSETGRALERQAYSLDNPQSLTLNTLTVKNQALQFFPTAEGFYDYKKDQYIYQYQDHLGNTRISFGRNISGNLELVDVNDYYPFGMNHLKSGASFFGVSSYKNYKYNGKELQETGMYDYGARMYMSDLGRWGAVDPLSEIYRRWSPYNYAVNNPIMFIDPDGKGVNDVILRGDQAKEAFEQLKNASSNLNLRMDSNGKVTGTIKKGTTATDAEKTLLSAMSNKSVVVDVLAQSSSVIESDNTAIFGGAFMGSNTNSSIDASLEGSPNKITTANQIINPKDLGVMDTYYGATKGVGVMHEILEAYSGAIESPGAINTVGLKNREVSWNSYLSAHNNAITLDPRIDYNLQSENKILPRAANGNIRIERTIFKQVKGVRESKSLGTVELKPKTR